MHIATRLARLAIPIIMSAHTTALPQASYNANLIKRDSNTPQPHRLDNFITEEALTNNLNRRDDPPSSDNFLTTTFSDTDDGPGVTINVEAALDVTRPLGFYTAINDTTYNSITFEQIILDLAKASPRLRPTLVKNAFLHLEDSITELFDEDHFVCDNDGISTRNLLEDRGNTNNLGHVTAAIAHTATGFGIGVGFYYAVNGVGNDTSTRAALLSGVQVALVVSTGRIFDSLQRNGQLNFSDAVITTGFLSLCENVVAAIKALGSGVFGGCLTAEAVQQQAAAIADAEDPGVGLTSYQRAVGIANDHGLGTLD